MKALHIWKRPVDTIILSWLLDHTFATTDNNWYSEAQVDNATEYWYCYADKFSGTLPNNLDKVVGVFAGDVDENFARCLTQPNIKKGDWRHDPHVAKGSYLSEWVCHQLTNRVLAALNGSPTIIDYNTNYIVAGYYLSVQRYGPYGRDIKEWLSRYHGCSKKSGIQSNPMKSKSRELKAIMSVFKGSTDATPASLETLDEINQYYLNQIESVFKAYQDKKISESELQSRVGLLEIQQLKATEELIGHEATIELHGLDAAQALDNFRGAADFSVEIEE